MSALDLTAAKEHLNVTGSTFDVEIQGMIDAAEAVIARWVGPLSPTAVTERVVPTGNRLVLSTLPTLSLTSVTPIVGPALTLTDLYLNTSAGVVTFQVPWRTGFVSPSYTVVYQAGRASVPADLLLAVKELVRHLFTSQRGSGTSRPGPSSMVEAPVGTGYAMPNRVAELLAPHTPLGMG